MAAFKNKDNGTWFVQFRYTNWKGERKQKCKRGFPTKREALAWEREFLLQKQADVNMTFESFVELYEKDVRPKLKGSTWCAKESIIRLKILPYFGKRQLCEITPKDVIDWQNEMREASGTNGGKVSPSYLKVQPRCPVLRPAKQSGQQGRRHGRRPAKGNAVLDEGRVYAVLRRSQGCARVLPRF